MSLQCGIVGLPNVGKSTIFNALTAAGAQMANYPFCTIEPNVGVVSVPDPRLDALAALAKPQKVIPTVMEFVDIAGLVKGASQGEGLGNQFLGHIRQVDAVAHVVRCFEDPDITHVSGSVDPARDIAVIDTELMLSDLATLEKRLATVGKKAKLGEKEAKAQAEVYERVRAALDQGIPVRRLSLSAEEREQLRDLFLITGKPVLYVCNVAESEVAAAQTPGQHPLVDQVRALAASEGAAVVAICGAIEAEIAELEADESIAFLESLELHDTGLHRLIEAAYRLLGLLTFFTVGPKEVRAWTIPANSTAPEAAGAIHSDFQRGFIRANTIGYEDFMACRGEQGAKEQGKMRQEGKEYVVRDGDVMHFLFNV